MRLAVKLILMFIMLSTTVSLADDRVIYGVDDRREIDDAANDRRMVSAARSVGMITQRNAIRSQAQGVRQLPQVSLRQRYNLCPKQVFENQPAPGLCSGFLVSSDLFLTAAHCVNAGTSCANIAIIFDFTASTYRHDKRPELVLAEDIYYCRTVLERVLYRDLGIDFALIQLDRPANGRPPLSLRRNGRIESEAKLTVISHPLGLPLKIAGGGRIRANTEDAYFVTDLDTFVGSSGAPVLNTLTGLVEGLVARGDRDWITTPDGCRIYSRCADRDCRGEDVVRISALVDYLPQRR